MANQDPWPGAPPPSPRPRPPAPPISLAESARLLDATRPWVRLAGIMTFIVAGLMVLGGIAIGVAGLGMGQLASAALGLLYLAMSALYFVPAVYLVRYAARIRDFVSEGQKVVQLESALDTQRAFWKFVGVLMVIGLVMMLLGIAAAIILPALIRARGLMHP